MKYKITQLLNEPQLEYIVNKCNKDLIWEPGTITTGSGSTKFALDLKNNIQAFVDIKFSKEIYGVIDKCKEFHNFTVPKSSSSPIFSKTIEGGFYKPHVDWEGLGHFSTTLFLSDPNSYDGGELCLLFDPNEETKVKLDPGWAITYETGTPHRVNTVTSGERLCMIFWTESCINNMEDLYKYRYYKDMLMRYNKDGKIFEDCIEFYNHPTTIFDTKCRNIMRKYMSRIR